MNTTIIAKITATHIIGTGMILTALGLGAGIGTLASPDNPANANTPETVTTCATMCPGQTYTGSTGNTNPAPLLHSGTGSTGKTG